MSVKEWSVDYMKLVNIFSTWKQHDPFSFNFLIYSDFPRTLQWNYIVIKFYCSKLVYTYISICIYGLKLVDMLIYIYSFSSVYSLFIFVKEKCAYTWQCEKLVLSLNFWLKFSSSLCCERAIFLWDPLSKARA